MTSSSAVHGEAWLGLMMNINSHLLIPALQNGPSPKLPPAGSFQVQLREEEQHIADSLANITLPDDEADYSGIMNDGLGEDDDGDEADKDGVFNDPDPTAQPVNNDGDPIPPKPCRTARPLPKWLQVQFNVKVEESKARENNNLAPLYLGHHNFWFPETDPYFPLRSWIRIWSPSSQCCR
ncbi:hypothetical protein DFH09DRAFT_1069075 [Mycena vulgaris]|nr:hypothetical protein DFH09DRAFT_1069075 [Mycena vulgaris]